MTTHSCSKADFFNNDTVDFTNIYELECLNITINSIQGIYTDEVFTYYEFSVLAKNDSVEFFRKKDDYLIEEDCRLELYYTEVAIISIG